MSLDNNQLPVYCLLFYPIQLLVATLKVAALTCLEQVARGSSREGCLSADLLPQRLLKSPPFTDLRHPSQKCPPE